ncbi:arylesterase [Alloalcanivorax balearicus]|uniref:arylesterase n=1 Tax=Alloalcanivorax balearicus TaxID=413232 RepID=UPI0021CD91C5|nr:arylesterase [Alloalcanivorax balearicus]
MSRCLLVILLFLAPLLGRAQGIVVLGDSISAGYGLQETEGWVHLLGQRLASQCSAMPVINASVSGETSDGGVSRLPALLERHQPDVLVLELGGNDGLRGLPPSRLAGNLEKMVSLGQQAGARVVLLGMRIPPNYGRAYTERFEAVFKQVAENNELPWVPFFLDGVVEAGRIQSDGIHPTAEAQPTLLDNAWPVLRQVLPKDCQQ